MGSGFKKKKNKIDMGTVGLNAKDWEQHSYIAKSKVYDRMVR